MKTFIIAEIGINYNGQLDNCYKLIDMAVKAGCSAAKFQLFSAKNLYPKSAGKLDWKDKEKEFSYDIYEAVKNFELPQDWIEPLMSYCKSKKIEFMASVFDKQGLDFLLKKDIEKIKLSSYTITNLPLIEAAAKAGVPIIMSSGGATLGETEDAVNTVLKYHDNLTLLHCSIAYPTKLSNANMGVLETFSKAFPDIKTGYSDHTSEISEAPVQAVYLGADVIEKHITLDKKMAGPDHFFALEPKELEKMVLDIRSAEKRYEEGNYFIDSAIYGNSAKICYKQEKYLRDFAYMTIFSRRKIKKGEVIRPEDLIILRNGKKEKGLEPKYLKLFEEYTVTAKNEIGIEDPITWKVIL